MSTRSITHIHEMRNLDPKERVICSFYRHNDGYPDGHGKDLSGWLDGKKLVNGIGWDFKRDVDFNRAGTMAVKLMNHIQDISCCEVISSGEEDHGEEFVYDIYFRDGKFEIVTTDIYAEKE